MENICTYLFGMARKVQPEAHKNGSCARCSKPIPPHSTCCIIGYDSRKNRHPRDECNHILCFQCINTLGFEYNATHVSNNNAVPTTVFFEKKTIDEFHKHQKEIHHASRNKKRQGKWKTKKRRN